MVAPLALEVATAGATVAAGGVGVQEAAAMAVESRAVAAMEAARAAVTMAAATAVVEVVMVVEAGARGNTFAAAPRR